MLVFKLQAANLAPNALYYQHSRGLFNLSSLQSADVFISLPRFNAVDESAVSNVSIVDQADGRAFEWNIFVEPRSGITMGKDIALQINFESPGYGAFEDLQLPAGPMPLLWSQDRETINRDDAQSFKDGVRQANSLQIAMFVVGPLMLCCCLLYACVVLWKCVVHRHKDEQIEMNPTYKT